VISASSVAAFCAAPAVVAELTSVRGSSPREAGTFMLISADATLGTIGGGALEYLVIQRAREALRDGVPAGVLDIPLGPEIGQCCGGRVAVALAFVTDPAPLVARIEADSAAWPHVFMFGAGHVGQALARALSALPLKLHVIDTRRDELDMLSPSIDTTALAMPEAAVRTAPSGSSYVILTHDHALDFLIAAEALQRADAPYVGMVGSKTKRAKFAAWFKAEGYDPQLLRRLVLPIGALGLVDKRPEVIAALAAAEIMVHIGRREAEISVVVPRAELTLGAEVD
jgi:xanthine dehydrogenase accessory factor